MKIAWIYPHRDRCGISLYSGRYLEALDGRAETCRFDPCDLFHRADGLFAQINECDIVHVQYETSFFMKGRSDFYGTILGRIRPPVIVSLHEIYETFPDVFPREELRGPAATLPLKRALYDHRHPLQTAFRRHTAEGFSAKAILVHQQYQKEILINSGIAPEKIMVLAHPVKIIGSRRRFPVWDPACGKPARLAACGYINPHYDYDLLFSTLRQLTIPWQFTWIGGLRRDEDEKLLEKIRAMIVENGWQERFSVTGWLPEKEHDAALVSADLFCALFSSRSSSGTLAAAIGAMVPIVATALPLTRELASRFGLLVCAENSGERVAREITALLTDVAIREKLEKNVGEYRENGDYGSMADLLVDRYKTLR